ncbi:MAG: hypothetical protein H7844_10915 [Nitrospirae bacterium YQR-1]
MTLFRDLLRISSQFVEKQKGYWDNNAWLNLLKDAQEKGVQLTGDMQAYLGTIVEAMKRIYETASIKQGLGKSLAEVTKVTYEQTVSFIEQTKGKWDHAGWEKFVKDVQQKGIALTEESRAYLGELLEAARKFYITLPAKGVPEMTEITPAAEKKATESAPASVEEPTTVENPKTAETVSKPDMEVAVKKTAAADKPKKAAIDKPKRAAKTTTTKSTGRKKTEK